MRKILRIAAVLLALAGVAAEPPGSPTAWRVDYVARFPDIASGDFIAPLTWRTSGTIRTWDLTVTDLADGGPFLQYIDNTGAIGGPFPAKFAIDDQQRHHIRIYAEQVGPNVVVNVDIDGRNEISEVITGATLGPITSHTRRSPRPAGRSRSVRNPL